MTRGRRQAIVAAALSLTVSAALAALVRPLFGTAQPMIHITWRAGTEGERAALERRFRLSEATPRARATWTYVPLDTSPESLRAIATHPAVEQTDGIDRARFRIAPGGPLTARRGGRFPDAARSMARVFKGGAYLFALAGILALAAGLGLADRLAARMSEAWDEFRRDPRTGAATAVRTSAAWLERGVPVASPRAAGIFRMVFGALVLAFVLANPVDIENLRPYELAAAEGPYGAALRWLVDHPQAIEAARVGLAASGVLFVAGVLTRWTYAFFVAALFVWGSVFTLLTTHHTVSALHLTMLALLAAPWGDGWSVDALLSRRRGARPAPGASRQYGYAIWIPALVLGVTFAAAAWSKVRGGPAWVLNGTVKYHFVTDLDDALVSWGPELTRYAWAAIALSAGAVLIEASAVVAAFRSSAILRLLAGAAALALLVGFKLFQGIVWPGWWLLLLGFLPWERLARAPAAASARSLTRVQTVVIAAIVLQQVYCSVFAVEARPLLSTYDMYSATYASPEDYEAQSNLVYRVLLVTSAGESELPDCQMDDRAAWLFDIAAHGGAGERQRIASLLRRCLDPVPREAPVLKLVGDRRVYDWNRGRFEWRRGLDVIGPVRVDWLEH